MDKERGEKKRKYLHKNKFKGKKLNYSDHRNNSSTYKYVRTFVNSYINHHIQNEYIINDFCYPTKIVNTLARWDECPHKPKVLKPWL
jgi:hypothetical protein